MIFDIDHTGKCIRRFGGIYAYCRYFIDRKWSKNGVNTILKNMPYAQRTKELDHF